MGVALADGSGAFSQGHGLGKAVDFFEQGGVPIQSFSDVGMVGAEGVLPDRQGALEERFGLRPTVLVAV